MGGKARLEPLASYGDLEREAWKQGGTNISAKYAKYAYSSPKVTCKSSQFFAGVNQQHPQPFPDLQFVRAVEKAVAALVEEPGQPRQGFQPGWSKVDTTLNVRIL